MTRTKRRLAPRQLFVVAGLLVVGITAYCDRHLLELPSVVRALDGFFDFGQGEGPGDEHAAPTPEVAGVQALRRALDELQVAESAFLEGFSSMQNWGEEPAVLGEDPELYSDLLGGDAFYDPACLDESDGWLAYWKVREKVWPAYAAAVEAFLLKARDAQRLDPNNGVFELLAGMVELDLCMNLSPVDPAFDMDIDLERGLARVHVSDPERLARALQAIERGLAASELTFRDSALIAGRAARFAHVPSLRGMGLQVGQAATVMMPELMVLKQRTVALTYLAHSAGGSGERALRLGRKVALRHGAEATSLIGLLVAIAELQRVDFAWLREAAAAGDVEASLAAHDEILNVNRQRETARRLHGTEVSRLGTFDALLTPAGGWGSPKPDFATNRLLDYALVESATVWALIFVAAFLLVPMAFIARSQVKPGVSMGAGFTLGDLLGVVLPSFAGVAALALVYSRLHPAREFGIMAGEGILAVGLQALVFVAVAAVAFLALLRRAALSKHGLPLRRPALARWSMGLFSLGAFVGLFWVGPYALGLAPVALGLLVLGLVGVGLSGLGAKAHTDPDLAKAVSRFEGRVGLACLGASLCLLGAVEAVLVTPRREALTERFTNLAVERFLHEAEYWGDGEPQNQFEAWLAEAPDKPTNPAAGQ